MMQDFSAGVCVAMTPYATDGMEFGLRDVRDDKYYKVRKLADGNCWMVDNLALDGSQTLDSTTSDIDSGTYSLGTVVSPNSQTYCANLDPAIYPNKCGNHYTWTVATIGSSGNPAVNSICPKNWRLPESAEYTTLRTALGWVSETGVGAVINSSAWRGLYAGYGASTRVGEYGYYWSANTNTTNNANAYVLSYNSSGVSNGNVEKSQPRSVRCLAR
jgi:uncharacterized protein (TIGR02145 family)